MFSNDEACSWLSSAGFGQTVGKSIDMDYKRSNHVRTTTDILSRDFELEVANARHKASVTLEPLVDPQMKNIKV